MEQTCQICLIKKKLLKLIQFFLVVGLLASLCVFPTIRHNLDIKMVFTRFVELGRVALINYGPDEGKLCVVIDVQDGKKALVDGPVAKTGVSRQVIGIKRLSLTDIKLPLAGRNPRQKQLTKLFDEADVMNKWEATSWAKKRAAKLRRANLTDFERFQVMVLRKQRGAIKRGNWRRMPVADRKANKKARRS